jgi:type I restriction enzyme S subunit
MTIPILNDIDIYVPSIPAQTAISSILSSLDDKIDLLHRQNATLEKLAETLFRQWFVEEAKEEWGTGKLGDEFVLTMGASPPGESYNEEGFGIPMYQGNADFGFRFPTNRVFTTDPKRFAEKYDTLVSVRAPVGEQNMANERCCIGRGVAAFRFKKDNSFYTYTYYKMKSLINDIKQFNETGTVFGSISKSDFENIEIVIPDKISIHKFQNEANPIDDKITTNTIQVRTLTALRDTLLPKLMSGKVRVEM